MTDLIRPTVNPGLPVSQAAPSVPDAAAKPEAAAHTAAEAPLAPAALGVLDTMMQGFLADGQLDATEAQAYQAARASFAGGWGGVPLPAGPDPDATPWQEGASAAATHVARAAPKPHLNKHAAAANLAAQHKALHDKHVPVPDADEADGTRRLQQAIKMRHAFETRAQRIDPNAPYLFWGDEPPTRKKGIAVVADMTFDWGARNPGLLGGWDSPPLGKTFVTADCLMPWGGYNDLHYWPDCRDPAYQAMWELRFAANNGDPAAWTEMATIKLAAGESALTAFSEQRPMQVSPQYPTFKDKFGPDQRAAQETIADMMLAARDRWKAGGTQVVMSDDPQFVEKQKAIYAGLIHDLDARIAEGAVPYVPAT